MSVAALVVAAGRGQRFGGSLPKQYAPLAGRPVLRHSLQTLAGHAAIDHVSTVIHPDDEALYAQAARSLGLPPATPGGATRQESVRLGLEALTGLAPDLVLVHDGARPFLDGPLIDRVLAGLDAAEGAVPALPMTDTVKQAVEDDGRTRVIETLERSTLWRTQTPQGFRFAPLLAAHRAAAGGPELTDDAAVAERAGLTVILVSGSEENIKVTTPQDLAAAEQRLGLGQRVEPRIGQGFDVHRFGPGDRVVLCGLPIPHPQALLGHSDADVGLHALTDAILGALGAGDIGSHFPPSDPRWRGADSARFLRHAVELVTARGGRIGNVDITLICERPKIGPHREAMIARVAQLLGISSDRVSIKATTTERLGFTGRGEGIAAQAVAALALPADAAAAAG